MQDIYILLPCDCDLSEQDAKRVFRTDRTFYFVSGKYTANKFPRKQIWTSDRSPFQKRILHTRVFKPQDTLRHDWINVGAHFYLYLLCVCRDTYFFTQTLGQGLSFPGPWAISLGVNCSQSPKYQKLGAPTPPHLTGNETDFWRCGVWTKGSLTMLPTLRLLIIEVSGCPRPRSLI